MGDIVDLPDIVSNALRLEDLLEALTDVVGQDLAVAEGEVRRTGHRLQVILPLRAIDGRAHQLLVGQLDAVFMDHPLEALEVIGADLVAEAAGAAMDLDGDLPLEEPHPLRAHRIEDLIHHIHLDEVVPGAQGAQLILPPLLGFRGRLVRIRVGHAAEFLGVLQILGPGVAVAQRPAGPLRQHLIQLPRRQGDVPFGAHPAGAVGIDPRRQLR